MIEAIPAPVAEACLRAMKTVAAADGKLHDLESELLDSLQRHVLHSEFDVSALGPVTPQELREIVPEDFREHVLHACIMMTLIDGEADESEVSLVDEFADALGVHDRSLKALHRFSAGRFKILRFDLLRRFIIADRVKKEAHDKGIRGIFELIKTALRGKNDALAARYRALGDLPQGTLGREYFEFMTSNEFAMPGEKGAAPEIIVFHDCNHVLGSYGTSAEEETQVAAFHAGYRAQDKFALILFLLMQFHLGVQITPATGGVEGVVKPELVLKAFERGTHVTQDLITEWDPREDFEVQVSELRERFNVLPRT
jgi:tellurite resistance protein